MKNDTTNKKILYTGLGALFLVFVVGIIIANNRPIEEEYTVALPAINDLYKQNTLQFFKDYLQHLKTPAETLNTNMRLSNNQ